MKLTIDIADPVPAILEQMEEYDRTGVIPSDVLLRSMIEAKRELNRSISFHFAYAMVKSEMLSYIHNQIKEAKK